VGQLHPSGCVILAARRCLVLVCNLVKQQLVSTSEKMKYKPGLYKFVVIGDFEPGPYFKDLRIFDYNEDHSSQLKSGETAVSAGTIAIISSYWKLYDSYSMTLGVGCNNAIIPLLNNVLGVPFKSE
jgi:hypothetical protein